MPPPHDGVEFVVGDSHHQVIPHDAAAHSTLAEKRETAEHLAFGHVFSTAQRLAKTIRELLVVRHADR
jgi:hypothetical protein